MLYSQIIHKNVYQDFFCCMLYHLWTTSTAAMQTVHADHGPREIFITMSGHDPVRMMLNPNGNLAHVDLPDVYVKGALIRNHPSATCFFRLDESDADIKDDIS